MANKHDVSGGYTVMTIAPGIAHLEAGVRIIRTAARSGKKIGGASNTAEVVEEMSKTTVRRSASA
jgi:hypothetical protein